MAFQDNTTGGRIIKEGRCPVKITLDLPSGGVRPGDLLGFDETGWEKADTDGGSGIPRYAELVAGQAGATGDIITAYREALIDFGSACEATLDDELFIHTTAGEYTTSSGSRGQPIGFMTSAQEAWICPQYHFFPKHISITHDNTSGDCSGFEVRCQRDSANDSEIKGLDISARVGDTYTCSAIAAVKGAINVKGTSGAVSNRVVCFHAELESGASSSRTIAGPVACYYGQNKMGSATYTKKVVLLHADSHGAGKAWDGFLSVQATGAAGVSVGGSMTLDPATDAISGLLKIFVDTTEYQIPFYAA